MAIFEVKLQLNVGKIPYTNAKPILANPTNFQYVNQTIDGVNIKVSPALTLVDEVITGQISGNSNDEVVHDTFSAGDSQYAIASESSPVDFENSSTLGAGPIDGQGNYIYVALSAIAVDAFFVGDPGRSILETSNIGVPSQTVDTSYYNTAEEIETLPQYEWVSLDLSTKPLPLFTTNSDVVDFNALTPDQAYAVATQPDLYHALAGNDVITLPDDANAASLVPGSTAPVTFDLTQTFHAGDGADTFDFTKDQGLNSYRAGETLHIDGDAPAPGADLSKSFATPSLVDKLVLPGSPGDYTFAVQYASTQSATHTLVSRSSATAAGPAIPVNIDTADIERVTFANAVANIVALSLSNLYAGGNLYAEAAELDKEVYGPNGFHVVPDGLASSGNSPNENIHVGDQAVARGWHEVSALELGMAPADFGQLSVSYSFANGFYQAQASLPGVGGQEDALVLIGIVGSERTLVVSIRGTDEASDFLDYGSFRDNAFPKLEPLLAAVLAYVQDPRNGIQRVVVTGHSLGGGLAQLFGAGLQTAVPVDVFTFGSPGAEASGPASEINFVHTDDPVAAVVPGVSQSQVVNALFGAAASALLPSTILSKSRSGSDVLINSDISSSRLSLAEHRIDGYVSDVDKLVAYAHDGASSFSTDPFASAILTGAIYTSKVPQIALGNGTSAGGVMNVDRGDRYVLGDLGKDDDIVWNGLSSVNKDIDGGGSKTLYGDKLILTSGSWSWNKAGNGYDLYRTNLSPGNILEGTFRRIGIVLLPGLFTSALSSESASSHASLTDPTAPQTGKTSIAVAGATAPDPASIVTHLDGTPTSVQRAALGSATLTADGTSDVTYAGPGVTDLQSSAAYAVLLYGADTARVTVTSGDATIASDGTSGAAVTIDTGNTPSVVVGGARAQVIIGHLAGATFEGGTGDSTVAYAGARSAYLLTTAADGSTTVSDTVGTGGDRLVGIQHVAFSDQIVNLAATLIPDPAPDFALQDVSANISSTTIGETYSGPVSYLQQQFTWSSTDSVNIRALTNNTFLKSGSGEDALQALGGSNVLGGSTGSNFLVGASGADGGTDTFFTDGCQSALDRDPGSACKRDPHRRLCRSARRGSCCASCRCQSRRCHSDG